MRFGAFLPTFWDHYGTTPIHVTIEEAAKAAERLGFEGGWANDRIIDIPTGEAGSIANLLVIEPLVTLTSLVHLVPRLSLGVAVLVLPQRNTILVAKQVAALHLLSGQRLILGVGIGHRPEEFALLGADYAQRADRTDEALEVMRTLWREPLAHYHGRFHNFDGVSLPPHPPDGGPQVWIGGDTLASVRRAARHGDGWLPYDWKLDAFRSGVSLLRELTQERKCPTIGNVFYFRIQRPDEPTPVRSTTPWAPPPFAGSTEDVARHLDAYCKAGLEYALVGFESEDIDDLLRQMSIFAGEIMPRFVA